VFLHELSHYAMAVVLQVKTGAFSLLPRPLPNGKLRLGYVETVQTDWVREALIGSAPLLAGGLFVAYAGLYRLGMNTLWPGLIEGGANALLDGIQQIYNRSDFWLWFYLTFAVSSTMLPSASDRRAWLPVSLIGFLLLAVTIVVGAGPWLAENSAPYLSRIFSAVTAILAISLTIHAVLLLPLFLVRRALNRLTGLEVR
jgi:hypothetical protein